MVDGVPDIGRSNDSHPMWNSESLNKFLTVLR